MRSVQRAMAGEVIELGTDVDISCVCLLHFCKAHGRLRGFVFGCFAGRIVFFFGTVIYPQFRSRQPSIGQLSLCVYFSVLSWLAPWFWLFVSLSLSPPKSLSLSHFLNPLVLTQHRNRRLSLVTQCKSVGVTQTQWCPLNSNGTLPAIPF